MILEYVPSVIITIDYEGLSVLYKPISETNHQSILSGSFNEKEFMPGIINQQLKDNDVVLDIGAHTGLWTIPMAKKIAPKGVVYAFEPERESLDALRENSILNSLQNIVVVQQAVSDGDGKSNFYIRPDSELHSFFEENPLSTTKEQYMVTVETTKISTLVENRAVRPPTFVKIDVEGAEILVLDGMKGVSSSIRAILLEIHQPILLSQGLSDPFREVELRLRNLGFENIHYLDNIHIFATR
jgi:FkbM family methyltransferase